MTTEQILASVIALNDARLGGHITREFHAVQIARLDGILTESGRSWADLQDMGA